MMNEVTQAQQQSQAAFKKDRLDEKGTAIRKCEQKLQDKLFLLSFDLIELNAFYNFYVYSIFLILDFLFLSFFPLNQIYNDYTYYSTANITTGGTNITSIHYNKNFVGESKDQYSSMVVRYLNVQYFISTMDYSSYLSIQQIVCLVMVVFFFIFTVLLVTRECGTINLSNQRKLLTKIYSFALVTLIKTLQIPLLTFMFFVYNCSNQKLSLHDSSIVCYQGQHMNTVIYTTFVACFYYLMVLYFHKMISLSYPHEKVPWAQLPTKAELLVEIQKFIVILVYSETTLSAYIITYVNIFIVLVSIFVLKQRLTQALIFNSTVYMITMATESMQIVIFTFASMRDFIPADRNFVFDILLVLSAALLAFTSSFIRDKIRYKFLSRVDFALYENYFDALVMMFTLHELIERSSYDEKQDFLLRGFIERHIEICEYPGCSCIKFYQICNASYRLELSQMSPFSKHYDSSSMNATATQNQNTTHSYTSRIESEVEELSTLKVFYGRQKSQKKQNKSKAKFLKKFLIDNINVFLDAFPSSVKLHIMAAFIYFSIFKNSFKSLYELSFTKSIKCSYYDQYECFVLSSSIISYFSSRANQGMSNQPVQLDKAKDKKKGKSGFSTSSFEVESEIKNVIEFEKINIIFQKMIEVASLQTQEFWEEILKKHINVFRIFELGELIYKNFIEIKKKYKYLMSINNNYLEVAYLYKLFVNQILNFEIEVEDAKLEIIKIMQAKSMKKHNLKTEYKSIQLEDENGMIIISGTTNNFTKIQAMNNKAERIFGYSTSDLLNQKMNKILPKIVCDSHDPFILNFIKGNRKINKDNHQFVWGKHQSGFIVPLIMDINAYVNFEFNFCFIAFLKRSVLLEFKPMRELLEYQDVYVFLTDINGVITDMTQNLNEYLNFPIRALNKDISVEAFFKSIFDDELEQNFMNGKRLDFNPNIIKRILEEEDIDVKDNDSDYETNLNASDKKCVSIVWLKNYEFDNSGTKLTYKEIWFVLTDDDTTFLDTKNTTEYQTQMDQEGPRVNVTYTDDREEICSIASVSSLANYDKNRKNILTKLSEIKSQTIDDTKPKQIDLLQKSIILVFLSVICIAVLVLIVSISRNNGFFRNIEIITESKTGFILFAQMRTMIATLLSASNSQYRALLLNNHLLQNVSNYLELEIETYIEQLRLIQSDLDFLEYNYSPSSLTLKDSYTVIQDVWANNIIEARVETQILALSECLNRIHDLIYSNATNFTFNSSFLNYDYSNSSLYRGSQTTIGQQSIYFVLKNMLGSLSNYLYSMSQTYISDAISQANNNSSLVLILTVISIAITFLTAFIIMPILHKIERSKEKVLMIYTELKKEQIEQLNRSIKVFFMKLQQSTNNPGGSLFYQNSSKQFSGKLMTRKFTTGRKTENDFASFLLQRQPMVKSGAGDNEAGETSSPNHFPLLFNKNQPQKEEQKEDKGKKGKSKVLKLGKRGVMKKQTGIKESVKMEDSSEEDEDKNLKNGKKNRDEQSEHLSDNAEEDKKADLLMSKEEAEHALFKRIFQQKIKSMTCMKKVKYYVLVLVTALFMSGYFTLSYFMVTQIFKESENSLSLLQIVSDRGPFLDSLITYYLQSVDRNKEIFVQSVTSPTSSPQWVNSIDYYQNLTSSLEVQYNEIRTTLPASIQFSAAFMDGLESQNMCQFLIQNVNVSNPLGEDMSNQTQMIEDCKNASNKLLQLGLTNAINSILQNILQGTIQFRNGSPLLYQKSQQLLDLISVKLKYLNSMDIQLLLSIKESINMYFAKKQQGYVMTFSIFAFLILTIMFVFSIYGVNYLLRNLIAIKFILNFIPGQWLLDNNAAEDLKYIDI